VKEALSLMLVVVVSLALWAGLIFVALSFYALIISLAWNYILVGLFGAPEISFWQSFGVVTAVGLLTGRLGIARNQDV
jgi:hypothetical protein